jgi:hypothetical protein
MRTANCPSCGAPITFRWSDAVQTTCEYCRSILVRHDVNLERVGEVAAMPEDASPIQIGTEGIFENRAFQVIGRIFYDYEQGGWNEWHLIFNDGKSGWLSDAQLEYAVSFLTDPKGPIPPEGELLHSQEIFFSGVAYYVASVTLANYAGVEGELPFEYWDKQRVAFADLRTHDGRFGTIDFSDSPPLLFFGQFVEYDSLKLKNVRLIEGWS